MKKNMRIENPKIDPSLELANAFWRWFSLSVFALLLAAAIPALSADVFIDEGDGDFAATPVSTPPVAAAPNAVVGKAPASEDIPPAGPGTEMPPPMDIGSPAPIDMPAATAETDASNAQKMNDLMATPPAGVKKAAKAAKKTAKASKKTTKKLVKKIDKKKKATAAKAKKKAGKKKVAASSKKKSSKVAGHGKTSKRKIASIAKFAGGKYATSSRSCALESTPGAGDVNGMTKVSRKLWVEDSDNTSYYKVYGKGGKAAYVSRDCF